jgi:hypothetical protein
MALAQRLTEQSQQSTSTPAEPAQVESKSPMDNPSRSLTRPGLQFR